jgi:16S rRNA (uracil1498-N3)-methyltransferase
MPPRFFVDQPLHSGAALPLPPGPARHVQVLRLQPGAAITLFNGRAGEWNATVTQMGRSDVAVQVGEHIDVDRELAHPVTLALGMPANERMDALVEKATELGVGVIQPLLCERSVMRLSGERAAKKVAHWQAVAIAACEQSGRTRVPRIAPVCALADWLREPPEPGAARWLLSLREGVALPVTTLSATGLVCLSGPEGGLTPTEEAAARAAGFAAVSLGPRVLRADTAPLAVLALLALGCRGSAI